MMYEEDTELDGGNVGIVEGEVVNVARSTVRNVDGGHVGLQQVCAFSIDAEKLETTQSASLITHGSDIDMHMGFSGVTVAETTSINYSISPVTISKKDSVVNRSAAGVMAASNISAQDSTALLVVAGKVEGNLTTLFDWKSAAAFGAAVAGVWGFIGLLRKK